MPSMKTMTPEAAQALYDEVYTCLNGPDTERFSWYGKKIRSIWCITSVKDAELYVVEVQDIRGYFILQRYYDGRLSLTSQDRIHNYKDEP
jgi:hypothetical protein